MKVELSIPQEPDFFSGLLTLPLTEDTRPKWRLKKPFHPLRTESSITLSMNDVVLASLRHLSVAGRDEDKNIAIVDGWFDMLRWHLGVFWEIWHRENCLAPAVESSAVGRFSGDHAKFSGEMIAGGFALKVFQLLGYGPQNMYFYPSSNKAGPDFVALDPSEDAETAVILRDGSRIGLEARCRSHPLRFKHGERAALRRKKKGFAGVLAVYLVHCRPYERRPGRATSERTKLVLLDPEWNSPSARPLFAYEVALRHYSAVLKAIGIWSSVDRAEAWLRLRESDEHLILSLDRGEPLRPRQGSYKPPKGILAKRIGGRRYYGRYFNDVLVAAGHMAADQLQEIVKNRDFGAIKFLGIQESVLIAIESGDLRRLCSNSDPAEIETGAAFGADGTTLVYRKPTEEEKAYIAQQLSKYMHRDL